MPQHREVVCGVDGSAASLAAVQFAAREAGARGCSLVLVHALGDDEPAEQRRRILERAVTVARQVAPGLETGTRLSAWDPAAVLAVASAQAQLLVVGMAGKDDPPESADRSIALDLLHRARCPLVVVRTRHQRHRGMVLAGLTGLGDQRILAEGAALAAAHGVPLLLQPIGGHTGDGADTANVDLDAIRNAHPGVEISGTGPGSLDHLLDRAEGAQALVLAGPPLLSGFAAPARVAIRRGPCPVVVVWPEGRENPMIAPAIPGLPPLPATPVPARP